MKPQLIRVLPTYDEIKRATELVHGQHKDRQECCPLALAVTRLCPGAVRSRMANTFGDVYTEEKHLYLTPVNRDEKYKQYSFTLGFDLKKEVAPVEILMWLTDDDTTAQEEADANEEFRKEQG